MKSSKTRQEVSWDDSTKVLNIEIFRIKDNGNFIVLGREYQDLLEYVKEKEGLNYE